MEKAALGGEVEDAKTPQQPDSVDSEVERKGGSTAIQYSDTVIECRQQYGE